MTQTALTVGTTGSGKVQGSANTGVCTLVRVSKKGDRYYTSCRITDPTGHTFGTSGWKGENWWRRFLDLGLIA